ncbi:MAG TPA: hypothetical protein VEW03_13130 [Longimicrobiaceae bacterium]|nr:hypothetical protein [Longimicrobiaceae bacterium]
MPTLLEDITSRDRTRVWSSSCAIIKLRDAAQLDELAGKLSEIEEKSQDLSLGGMVFPNAEHLRFALRKLAYHRERTGCLCRLYPEYLFFNPEEEAAGGHIRIDDVTYTENKWVEAYHCTCTACGARYRVEEGESHYTWWQWSAVS